MSKETYPIQCDCGNNIFRGIFEKHYIDICDSVFIICTECKKRIEIYGYAGEGTGYTKEKEEE